MTDDAQLQALREQVALANRLPHHYGLGAVSGARQRAGAGLRAFRKPLGLVPPCAIRAFVLTLRA